MKHLLLITLLFIGCGGEPDAETITFKDSIVLDQQKGELMWEMFGMDTRKARGCSPEFLKWCDSLGIEMVHYERDFQPDSFIVGYDTTGCERVVVSCDTVWYDTRGAGYMGMFTTQDVYGWQFTTKPRYAPCVVVQLDSAKYFKLMEMVAERLQSSRSQKIDSIYESITEVLSRRLTPDCSESEASDD